MHVQQGELRWFCDCMVRPQRARGKEGNWVQTMPGKRWNVLLRIGRSDNLSKKYPERERRTIGIGSRVFRHSLPARKERMAWVHQLEL